ncbi:hypothetical protein NYR97_12805 [Xanthomonas hydrangeae]|uniref:Uncharacterized protein n=1 Tax=Xanthomonas hydrangeae TaxID=2775159 RepID=A0AAU0B9X8_9XANT|nr:hypothetical protein [Xanthomonas hydrangeae]WOB48158.1 hypothetical protein NYR97_12805 [Xanthomonas hydrangeae]
MELRAVFGCSILPVLRDAQNAWRKAVHLVPMDARGIYRADKR